MRIIAAGARKRRPIGEIAGAHEHEGNAWEREIFLFPSLALYDNPHPHPPWNSSACLRASWEVRHLNTKHDQSSVSLKQRYSVKEPTNRQTNKQTNKQTNTNLQVRVIKRRFKTWHLILKHVSR